jgi:hypothetical protein
MVEILNKILQNQIDPNTVMAKLDEILKALPPPRRELSDAQVNDFANKLVGVRSKITLVAAASTDDITPLFERICQAAHGAQWGCSRQSFGSILASSGPPSGKGIKCYANNWDREDAVRLKAAMAAVNLNCETITGGYTWGGIGINYGGLTIVIGTPSP